MDHYEQIKRYANDVKFAVMIVVDSRQEIKKNSPNSVKDCFDFKMNEQDGIITAIFIIQVSDKNPSER